MSSFGEQKRRGVFSGRSFRENLLRLQEPFGEISQAVSIEKFGKRRGEEGGKGERMWGRGREN